MAAEAHVRLQTADGTALVETIAQLWNSHEIRWMVKLPWVDVSTNPSYSDWVSDLPFEDFDRLHATFRRSYDGFINVHREAATSYARQGKTEMSEAEAKVGAEYAAELVLLDEIAARVQTEPGLTIRLTLSDWDSGY